MTLLLQGWAGNCALGRQLRFGWLSLCNPLPPAQWTAWWVVPCRYQLIAGVIEERGIEVFVPNRALCTVLSFAVRTGNTFLGSLLWVDYLRLIGLQKKE